MGLLTNKHPWGRIRGVIRITGAKALKDFNFHTKPGAEGILLRQYKYTTYGGKRTSGTFINNFVPPTNPRSAAQNANRIDKFGVISNAANRNLPVLRYIWQVLAERTRSKGPQWGNRFRSVNMGLVGSPPDFDKLLISDGRLEPTSQITSVSLLWSPDRVKIDFDSQCYHNGNPDDLVHGAIFIHLNKTLTFPRPTQVWRRKDATWEAFYPGLVHASDITSFVFFSDAANYSPSVSLHG
jgi:hypothetical protein